MKQTFRTLMIAAAAGFSLFSYASFGEPTNPLIGTWVLNVQKSTFDPGPPVTSHSNTITDAGNGALHFSVKLVEGDGKSSHFELTAKPDGKASPVTGDPDYVDSAAITSAKPGTFHIVFTKAGKRVEWDTFTVSKDGKSMVGHLAGDDNGTPWKYHWVSERQ
jgi:hypothetical protein